MQFPPEWTFADAANLEAYLYSRTKDRKPGMEIIVHFLDGKAGDFRIVLGGASIVSMKFDGSKIFGPRFEGYTFLLEQWPSEIFIRHNMASSAWFDGELAIRSNRLTVFTPDGQPDEEDSVLTLFTADKRTVVGASLRWAVVVGDDCRPALMLQSLPLAENSLTAKPPLRGDAPPIISLGSVTLACVMFDGGVAAGPVPIIACLEEERPAFVGDPLSAHRELQRIMGIFGQPEYLLSFKDAAAFVKKPKPGLRDFPFKRRAPSPTPPPAAKKPKTQETKPGSFLY
jgi:hypothetical protein